MPKVQITASPKVGTLAFTHEGDLVVVSHGAVIDASAWEAAQQLDALKRPLAKGLISAAPSAEPVAEPEPALEPSTVDDEILGVDFELRQG